MKSTMKKVAVLFLSALFLMGGVVTAQQNQMMQQQQQSQKDYSKEEINLFADAVVKVLPIQKEAEQKMVKEIENFEGMNLQEFNKIARQMRQGGQPEGVSDEKMQSFKELSQKIQGVQMKSQQKMNKAISDAGMSPAKYQEMMSAYSSNSEIKKKVDEKLAEQQQQ